MVTSKGIFTTKSSCPEYFKYQLYDPLSLFSDDFGYVHFMSEAYRDAYDKGRLKKSQCKHEITYPEDGLERELDNISHYRHVWFCNKCNRYVVEVER